MISAAIGGCCVDICCVAATLTHTHTHHFQRINQKLRECVTIAVFKYLKVPHAEYGTTTCVEEHKYRFCLN